MVMSISKSRINVNGIPDSRPGQGERGSGTMATGGGYGGRAGGWVSSFNISKIKKDQKAQVQKFSKIKKGPSKKFRKNKKTFTA